MKYKGIELKEFTSEKPVLFDPPRRMLAWDDTSPCPVMCNVCAFLPNRGENCCQVIAEVTYWQHCAEIPEETKPRRATNRELAKWLAQGKGEKKYVDECEPVDGTFYASNDYTYDCSEAESPVEGCFEIRKWGDQEWHEPTVDYMGLEE